MAAFDDADRTTRSRLSNPRTRRHLLRARIARCDVKMSPGAWSAATVGRPSASRESERFVTLLSQIERGGRGGGRAAARRRGARGSELGGRDPVWRPALRPAARARLEVGESAKKLSSGKRTTVDRGPARAAAFQFHSIYRATTE